MSVVINSMDMPKNCWNCPMLNGTDECCLLSDEQNEVYDGDIEQIRSAFCPLTEVPNLHIEVEKAIKSARRKFVAAQNAEREIFSLLEDMYIDAHLIPTEAENSSNLDDAISCYLQYGEYSLSKIMSEIRSAYGEEG